MDRHSSYIFIWLQLELCAMAVLLTRGEGPRRGTRGRLRGSWSAGAAPAGAGCLRLPPEGGRARRCVGTPRRAVLAAEPPGRYLPPLRPSLPTWPPVPGSHSPAGVPAGAAAPGPVPARWDPGAPGLCSVVWPPGERPPGQRRPAGCR